MKVAIIGSNGYLGRNLSLAFERLGIEILSLSATGGNGIDPMTGLLPEGFSIPAGIDTVYYLAQSPYYRQVPEFSAHVLSVNCLSAVQIAEAARKAGVKRLVYTSTGNVYCPSFYPLSEEHPLRRDNWYSLSKVMAEDSLNLYRNDIEILVVRIFGIYGPGQTDKFVPSLIKTIRGGKELFVERNPLDANDEGGLKISLLYIDDAISILVKLTSFSTIEPVINLAGAVPLSVAEIAYHAGDILKKPPKIILSGHNREGDLIADISKLKMLTECDFTDHVYGLRTVLKHYS